MLGTRSIGVAGKWLGGGALRQWLCFELVLNFRLFLRSRHLLCSWKHKHTHQQEECVCVCVCVCVRVRVRESACQGLFNA